MLLLYSIKIAEWPPFEGYSAWLCERLSMFLIVLLSLLALSLEKGILIVLITDHRLSIYFKNVGLQIDYLNEDMNIFWVEDDKITLFSSNLEFQIFYNFKHIFKATETN